MGLAHRLCKKHGVDRTNKTLFGKVLKYSHENSIAYSNLEGREEQFNNGFTEYMAKKETRFFAGINKNTGITGWM